jgi:hypothetical protein
MRAVHVHLRNAFLAALVPLIVLVLFVGLYGGLHGPSTEIVLPVVAGIGLLLCVILAVAFGLRHLTVWEYKEVRDSELQHCEPSEQSVCKAQASLLPSGQSQGLALDRCVNAKDELGRPKYSDQAPCTFTIKQACLDFGKRYDPQFSQFAATQKETDVLNFCNRLVNVAESSER